MKEEYIRYFSLCTAAFLLRQEENLEDFTRRPVYHLKKVNGFCVFSCTINSQKKTGSIKAASIKGIFMSKNTADGKTPDPLQSEKGFLYLKHYGPKDSGSA